MKDESPLAGGGKKKAIQSQNAFQESEQNFMDVLRGSRDAMLLIEDYQFIDCNDAAVKILGYPNREAFLAAAPAALSPPLQPDGQSSTEKAKEMMDIAIREGSHRFEWIHQKANGEDFPVEVSLTAIVAQGTNRILCVWRDITKQKKAEEALHASEQLYRLLVQNVDVGITLMDSDYSITKINDAQCCMFGKQPEEFHGKKCYREFEKRDAPCAHCPGTQAMASGQPASVETTGILDDGSTFIARVSACPVIADDGKTTGFIELVEDVTEYRKAQEAIVEENAKTAQVAAELAETNRRLEREVAEHRQAEAELLVSQTKYKTLYESSADAIMLRTPDRRIISGNRAAVALFGCKDEKELISLPMTDLYPDYQPNGLPSSEQAAEKMAIAIRDGSAILEWRYKRRDGTEFDATISITAMDIEGEHYILTTVRDITEQKRAEEAVRASEAKYRTLYDSSSDAILLRSPERKVVSANRAAVALFGYNDEEELKSTTPEDFYAEYQPDGSLSSEKATRMAEIALQDGSHSFEWKYRRKDENRILGQCIMDKNGVGRQADLADNNPRYHRTEACRAGDSGVQNSRGAVCRRHRPDRPERERPLRE